MITAISTIAVMTASAKNRCTGPAYRRRDEVPSAPAAGPTPARREPSGFEGEWGLLVVAVRVVDQLEVPGPELVDPAEGPLEGVGAGPGERRVLLAGGVDPLADLLHLALELAPLLRKLAQEAEDLVGGAREAEVLDHLTDERQDDEQGERGAEHDAVTDGGVEDGVVLLVDEGVELLVGDEQQDKVDRAAPGVDVVAVAELADPGPHVAEEVVAVPLALEVGGGVAEPDVVVERELDVHVQQQVVGQEERVVGDPAAGVEGPLLAVVDVLDEPGEAEDVLGHALAPLAPGLGAGQRLPKALGGVEQGCHAFVLAGELGVELPEGPGALGLDVLHHR